MSLPDNIKVLAGHNRSRFPYCNSVYLNDQVRLLVDTGCGQTPMESGLPEPDIILFSHFHLDHIRGNKEYPTSRKAIHSLDAPPLQDESVFAQYTGLDSLSPEAKNPLISMVKGDFEAPSQLLSQGDLLDLGKMRLRVIHTPGHSPGHICLHEERTGGLILGDIDLSPFGPWYGHPVCDIDAFLASINRLKSLEVRWAIPGHGPLLKGDLKTALKAYSERVYARETAILSFLSSPRTPEEIASRLFIYGRLPEPKEAYLHFERVMVSKHLKRLEREGRVLRTESGFVARSLNNSSSTAYRPGEP